MAKTISMTDSPGKPKSGLTLNLAVNEKKVKPMYDVELKSPTSVEMKNSFIIQNQNPAFDTYA